MADDDSGLTRVRVPTEVVFRPFGEEVVLLNLKTGQYHGLNPSAGRIFEVLREVGDVDAAVSRLAVEFGMPPEAVRDDVMQLCRQLIERSLMETVP